MTHKLFLDKIFKTPDDNKFEIAELKGKGHPDTLSDALASRISIDYAKWWMNELGVGVEQVPHHNFDKILLAGGEVNIKWGGGEVIKPFNTILAGNATIKQGNIEIPLKQIVSLSASALFRKSIGMKVEWDLDISNVSTSSQALSNTYSQGLFANDTSFGTGHYPLTKLEQTMYDVNIELEKIMQNKKFLGTDVKIMGRRINDEYVFTLAAGIKDESVNSEKDYFNHLSYIQEKILNKLPEPSRLSINQNDTPKKGTNEENYYLLVTGSSVENADHGQVGRGNRVTGMITPFRPQTIEAIAGKNLTRHVGGFYNIWAQQISKKIWERTGVGSQVVIVSEIGKPIQDCYIGVSSKQEVNKEIANETCNKVIKGYNDYLNDLMINGGGKHYPFNYVT
ncbi:MAG: hypothetical protein GON13_01110 [Nanoarchaeota archaeon]|nr:hypothetical protein [Nanoarchaeota archaeon]